MSSLYDQPTPCATVCHGTLIMHLYESQLMLQGVSARGHNVRQPLKMKFLAASYFLRHEGSNVGDGLGCMKSILPYPQPNATIHPSAILTQQQTLNLIRAKQ